MTLEPFCKLTDPTTYVSCDWNFCEDHEGRAYWVSFFKRHVETILKLGVDAAVARKEALHQAEARACACRDEYHLAFDAFHAEPGKYDRVDILTLDAWRDGLLRKHGFDDAFIDLKNRENAAALTCLPQVCRQLNALAGEEQLRAVVEGVF